MEVTEFALGFGPKLFSRRCSRGTEFSFRAIPLGGFVRTKGMEPKADGSETKIANGFYGMGLASRALVLFAGPLFSILFGFLLFVTAFVAFGEEKVSDAPIVGRVEDGAPAALAGLKRGDKILAINGQPVSVFGEMRKFIQAAKGAPVKVDVQRSGTTVSYKIKPRLKKDALVLDEKGEPTFDNEGEPITAPQYQLGVAPRSVEIPVGLPRATTMAANACWSIIAGTAKVLSSPQRLKENAGGPISITTAASRTTEEGVPYFIRLAGLISVSLGLINLLPIPLMDGGQLLVVGVEALRGGRRLSLKTQEVIGFVGIVIIVLIFLSVTYLDIGRLRNIK